MQTSFITRITALLACICLLALSACGKTASESEESSFGEQPPQAMGRYLEEKLPLPTTGWVYDMRMLDDGSLIFFAKEEKNCVIWKSTDSGESWEQLRYDWLDDMAAAGDVSMAYFQPNGDVVVVYTDFDEEEFDEEAEIEEIIAYLREHCHIAVGNAQGLEELPTAVKQLDINGIPTGAEIADNGDLIINNYFTVEQADMATGKIKFSYPQDMSVAPGKYLVLGDNLYIGHKDKAVLYDLGTGEQTVELVYTNKPTDTFKEKYLIRPFALDPQEEGLFYLDDSGLYRTTLDGALTEQLIDGPLVSFSMPSVRPYQLFACEDGSFLLLCSENREFTLLRYRYHTDVPRVPGSVLKVYSLEENPTLRQAIGLFQMDNPDIVVEYTVGLSGDSGITAADAVRSLNTELLAGGGPDLLVLDGLPLDSYMEKGVLADIHSLVDGDLRAGELVEAVVLTCASGDALYAVPARYSLPMAAGAGIGDVRTIQDLAEYLESSGAKDLNLWAGDLVSYFYPLRAQQWFDQDGTLQEEVFRADLEQLRHIADLVDPKKEERGEASYDSAHFGSVMRYISGLQTIQIGLVHQVSKTELLYSSFLKLGEGELLPFPGEEGIFIPRTILGVNTGSAEQDTAKAFLQFVLSDEVQRISLDDGLAVRIASLEASAKSPVEEGKSTGSYGWTEKDPETGDVLIEGGLDAYFPAGEFLEKLLTDAKNVQTPALENAVVKQIVLAETADYMAGQASLDSTVKAVSNKIFLYLAE